MEQLLEIAGTYGFPGLIVLGMGWFTFKMMMWHREERKELTDSLRGQHKEAIDYADRASKSLDNNTMVLTELRTMIHTQFRK